MSGFSLNIKLDSPAQKVDFYGLAKEWRQEIIEIRMVGMGVFSSSPSLLNKVRGALGAVLLESGSFAVRERRPCDWRTTCAAEVFFGKKPQIKIGPYCSEITKPYVLYARREEQDLVIGMSVFGFACEWIRELTPALLQALQARVRWQDLSKDRNGFIPKKIEILEPYIKLHNPILLSEDPKSVEIKFLTPLDAERGGLDSRPYLIFERLMLRISMLARWHYIDLNTSWDLLEVDWMACDFSLFIPEKVRYGGHKFKNNTALEQTVVIEGNLKKIWPLLVIGEQVNIGRGATLGLGHYRITVLDHPHKLCYSEL